MNFLFGGIASLANTIISRLFPDKDKQDQRAYDLASKAIDNTAVVQKAQADVNAASASNPNLFVSGARAFIMWVCGLAFAWDLFLKPLVSYFAVLSGHPIPNLPSLDMQSLLRVLLGLLGLN